MIHKQQITVILVLLVCICCVQGASAGAPPLKDRAGYLLPYLPTPHINQSIGDCVVGTDSFDVSGFAAPGNQLPESVPFFLNLSENNAFMNISCERTGDHYVSEVWYFDNWDEFRAQREHLFSYLTQHGTVTNVTLDLSEELALTNDTYLAGLKTRQVRAIKYENTTTSGYFLIFDTGFFPGPSYYIAYYGVVGSSGVQEHTPQLETLIMTTFPRFMERQTYENNPELPMTRSTPLPVIILIIAFGIVGLIRELQRRR